MSKNLENKSDFDLEHSLNRRWLKEKNPQRYIDLRKSLADIFVLYNATPLQRKEASRFAYFFVSQFPIDIVFINHAVIEILKHRDEAELTIYCEFLKQYIREAVQLGFKSTFYAFGPQENEIAKEQTGKPLYTFSNMMMLKIYTADMISQHTEHQLKVFEAVSDLLDVAKQMILLKKSIREDSRLINFDSIQISILYFLKKLLSLKTVFIRTRLDKVFPDSISFLHNELLSIQNQEPETISSGKNAETVLADVQEKILPLARHVFGDRPYGIVGGVVDSHFKFHSLRGDYSRSQTANKSPIPDRDYLKKMELIVTFGERLDRDRQSSRMIGVKQMKNVFEPYKDENGELTCLFLEEYKKVIRAELVENEQQVETTEPEANVSPEKQVATGVNKDKITEIERAFGLTLKEVTQLYKWEWNTYHTQEDTVVEPLLGRAA